MPAKGLQYHFTVALLLVSLSMALLFPSVLQDATAIAAYWFGAGMFILDIMRRLPAPAYVTTPPDGADVSGKPKGKPGK